MLKSHSQHITLHVAVALPWTVILADIKFHEKRDSDIKKELRKIQNITNIKRGVGINIYLRLKKIDSKPEK